MITFANAKKRKYWDDNMIAISHARGHLIGFRQGHWYFLDTGEPLNYSRACIQCGLFPTKEGYDACVGFIPGITSACCGHGVGDKIKQ